MNYKLSDVLYPYFICSNNLQIIDEHFLLQELQKLLSFTYISEKETHEIVLSQLNQVFNELEDMVSYNIDLKRVIIILLLFCFTMFNFIFLYLFHYFHSVLKNIMQIIQYLNLFLGH